MEIACMEIACMEITCMEIACMEIAWRSNIGSVRRVAEQCDAAGRSLYPLRLRQGEGVAFTAVIDGV